MLIGTASSLSGSPRTKSTREKRTPARQIARSSPRRAFAAVGASAAPVAPRGGVDRRKRARTTRLRTAGTPLRSTVDCSRRARRRSRRRAWRCGRRRWSAACPHRSCPPPARSRAAGVSTEPSRRLPLCLLGHPESCRERRRRRRGTPRSRATGAATWRLTTLPTWPSSPGHAIVAVRAVSRRRGAQPRRPRRFGPRPRRRRDEHLRVSRS